MNKIIFFFCLLSSTLSVAQKTIMFNNSQEVDPKRYEDIKGSPMLFEDYVVGTVIDIDGQELKDLMVNFNSFTETIEVKVDDTKYVILNPNTHVKVIIKDPKAKEQLGLEFLDAIEIKKVLHPKMKDKYALSVFEGKGYQLLKYFTASVITNKKEIPGETVKIQRFNPKGIMVLFDHGHKIEFNLKKKSMNNNLPDKFEIKKRAKRKRSNIYTYEGLVDVIKELIEKGK